jgi:hypothetical protein
MLQSCPGSPLVPDIQWHYDRVHRALALGRNGVDVVESWVAHPVRNGLFVIATQSSMFGHTAGFFITFLMPLW